MEIIPDEKLYEIFKKSVINNNKVVDIVNLFIKFIY